jgi:hypothetical protein
MPTNQRHIFYCYTLRLRHAISFTALREEGHLMNMRM